MQTRDGKKYHITFINIAQGIVIPICLKANMRILKCLNITRMKLTN